MRSEIRLGVVQEGGGSKYHAAPFYGLSCEAEHGRDFGVHEHIDTSLSVQWSCPISFAPEGASDASPKWRERVIDSAILAVVDEFDDELGCVGDDFAQSYAAS